MLVLSRKRGQSVILELPNGEIVEVYLTKIDYDQCKFGFEAPADVKITRSELYYKGSDYDTDMQYD